MADEKMKMDENPKKERFEYVLRLNGNIICARYVRIVGFKPESESSEQLRQTLHKCVEIIKGDLQHKSEVYLWNSAPQVFENKSEMDKWVGLNAKTYFDEDGVECRFTFAIPVGGFAVLRDTEEVFVWGGESFEKYDKYYNVSDYIVKDNEQKNTLKLTFLDHGREVCSEEWDANVYPRFVRSYIDLTNKKNKYKEDENFSIYDATLVDMMNKGLEDRLPIIAQEFVNCCSFEDASDYITTKSFGSQTYNMSIRSANAKLMRSMEKKYRAKTEKYNDLLEKFYNDKAYK